METKEKVAKLHKKTAKRKNRINKSKGKQKTKSQFKKELNDEMFEALVDKSVDDFCREHKLDKCFHICKRYAYDILKKDNDAMWYLPILSNPYRLMKAEGNGFKGADKVALQLGFATDSKQRILAFVGVALEATSNGSTIIRLGEVLEYMAKELKINNNHRIIDVVLNQSDGSYLFLTNECKRTTDIMEAVYLTKTSWFNTEKSLYEMFIRLGKSEVSKIEGIDEIRKDILDNAPFNLNEKQLEIVNTFDKFNINILTGVSGGGKTFTTKTILDCLEKAGQTFTILCPTGIASKVLTESTGHYAQTIHSFYYSMRDEGITTDWLVLDETSMDSVSHFGMIMNLIYGDYPPKILLVGDCSQLPSIEAGNVFDSIIKMVEDGKIKGNIVKLTQIMRASDETFIPHLCNQFVGDGKYDSSCETKELANVEFYKLEEDLPRQILDIIQTKGLDITKTCIIIPQNVGDYGNNVVNEVLDVELAGKILYQDKFRTYRENSILMHTKNNKQMGLYNGEKMRLLRHGKDKFVCERLSDGAIFEYKEEVFKSETSKSYSNTVHRLQGCTFETVIFVASKKYTHMYTKQLVYTGLSRASKRLIVLYDDYLLEMAHKKSTLGTRTTFLSLLANR